MSLGAAYEDDAIQALTNSAAAPSKPSPEKASLWRTLPEEIGRTVNALPMGVAQAVAEVASHGADIVGGLRYMRDATPEQRRQMDRQGVPISAYSSETGDILRSVARSFKPDPVTASTAEQLVAGFGRGAVKVVAGAVAAGPAGVVAAGLEEAATQSDELRQQGVDFNTRAKAGLVQGAGLALAALPVIGQTPAATAALYAIGGPGGFMAQQAATLEILQGAGYDKIGAQFDPFDPVGLAVATLLPAGFAAYGLRQQKLQRAVDSLPDLPPRTEAAPPAAETAPPAPFPSRPSAIADAVRAYPTEAVDAARVVLLSERRAAANPGAPDNLRAMDQHEAALTRAEDQLAAGEPVQVADLAPAPRLPTVETPEFRAWFDGSRVVTPEGAPMVLYHGTGADIMQFQVSERGEFGGGIYMTPEAGGASGYATYRGQGPANVMPVYVSIKNPAGAAEASQVASWKGEENARAELIRRGYDGVVDMRSGQVVAFYPEQVKSAIGNSGAFDPTTGSLTDSPYATWADQMTAAIREMQAQARPTDAPTTPQAANPEAAAPARGAGEPPATAGAADSGRPAGVEAAGLTPKTDAQIGAELQAKITSDFNAAVVEYSALPDAGGGKILNTDTARELSPDYLADRTKSAAVHEPASQFIKDLYARKLAEEPGPGELPMVLFTAGGTGAGKTSALAGLPSMAGMVDQAQIVYDTNMNGYASSKLKVDQALQAGKDVTIVLVARDPEDALVNGALPRAENQRRKFGTGRTVPLAEHIKTHIGAVETINRLVAEYAGNPGVYIRVVDNSLGKGKATERDHAWLGQLRYNAIEQRVTAALEREYAAGRITAETYRGFAGKDPGTDQAVSGSAGQAGQVPAGDRPGVRQGAEPAGPEAGLIGSETSAITERGLTVPLRYRLAEAGELTTSHTNDLTANPAFPAELQPRDRARAASAEQISRIENAIKPELLGESVKASDGAPIVGPDAVVESGNARTIALRRAYEGGKADAYRAWLADNAERFGLTRQQVEGMQQPVLVRERLGQVDRAEFARQANESAVAAMSPTEQAMSDARRITDLTGLVANEDGTINMAQSADFVRQFVGLVAPTERGTMLQANGQLSQAGANRLRNAVFAKAYGDADILAMLTESTDANVRNILAGMLRAAPEVAKLTDLAQAGARQDADIAGPLVEAVRLFSQLRSEGRTVQQFMAQGSMFGDGLSPEIAAMLEAVSLNARAPKRIAEMINGMVDSVNALGDTRQMGMFGDAPTGADAVAGAAERAVMDSRLTMAAEKFPALEVMVDGMEKPMPMAEFLAAAKAAADDLAADAPLMQIAAECALLNGAG